MTKLGGLLYQLYAGLLISLGEKRVGPADQNVTLLRGSLSRGSANRVRMINRRSNLGSFLSRCLRIGGANPKPDFLHFRGAGS